MEAPSLKMNWESALNEAISMLLDHYRVNPAHREETPQRVVNAFKELMYGHLVDPRTILSTAFEEGRYDQMIVVSNIDFVSLCEHHLLPFYGKVHFGYLPDKKIVGLSKIPRLVEALSRQAQVQECFTQQLASIFQEVVTPLGCGAVVTAWHSCVAIRGVRKPNVNMRTVALTGNFRNPDVKVEFLTAVRMNGEVT